MGNWLCDIDDKDNNGNSGDGGAGDGGGSNGGSGDSDDDGDGGGNGCDADVHHSAGVKVETWRHTETWIQISAPPLTPYVILDNQLLRDSVSSSVKWE